MDSSSTSEKQGFTQRSFQGGACVCVCLREDNSSGSDRMEALP